MSFGTTDQRAYGRYANHTSITCFGCGANLVGLTMDYGFADGHGRFAKFCAECRMHTYYDGPQPMAEPRELPAVRIPPEFPRHRMTAPTPLPTLESDIERARSPMALTIMVRVLIVVWCLAAVWVYAS